MLVVKVSWSVTNWYINFHAFQKLSCIKQVNCWNFGWEPHKICLPNVEIDACKVDPQLLKYWLCCVEFSNSFIQSCSNVKHKMKIKLKLKGHSLLISMSIRLLENISYGGHVNRCLKLCFTLSFSCLFLAFVIDFC